MLSFVLNRFWLPFWIMTAVVEEERSRRLGELGSGGWGGGSECFAGQEGEDTCGGFFSKKRRSSTQELGTTVPGEVAFAPTHVRLPTLSPSFFV